MKLSDEQILELALERLNGREFTRSHIIRRFRVGKNNADETVKRIDAAYQSIVFKHISLIRPTRTTS